MRSIGGRVAALAVLAVAVAIPAQAGERTVWDRAAGTTGRDASYRALMARGDQLVERAAEQVNLGETQQGRANSYALRAAEAYEKAAALRPAAAEPHYRAAEVLYAHFVNVSDHLGIESAKVAQRAVAHWDRFEKLAPRDPRMREGALLPGVHLSGVLFRRSITLTKLGGIANYKRSAYDYDALLRLTDSATENPQDMALYLSNAAEIHMASGDLERAIELYIESLEFFQKELYGYGLIVALDRDGQATRALEMMRDYGYDENILFHPPKPEEPPFFVPDGDVFWYQSIGNESLGRYDSAINFMKRFLESQPKSPYVARARERIKSLEVKQRHYKGKKPPAVQSVEEYRRTWELPPSEMEKLRSDPKKGKKKKKKSK